MSDLKITHLSKRFGGVEILRDVNLDIRSGEFIVFVGPSGCGKSTLLRCISGLELISEGTIAIDRVVANDISPARRGIAMVFQNYALYPHMTVFGNMAYAMRIAGRPKDEIRAKVEAVADKLRLTPYLARRPRELSGGQRQRVAIGRAIVRDPRVFLFDEPLSNLDAELRVQMRIEIAQLKQQLPGTTMIYVTHDQVEAMTMASRIVVLKDGVVQQVGAPMDLYEQPASLFVAGFIGSPRMNFFTDAYAAGFNAHTVGVRPEHLAIGETGRWSGRVVHAEQLGSDSYLYVDIDSGTNIVVREVGAASHRAGDQIALEPQPGRLHRFDASGNPLAG